MSAHIKLFRLSALALALGAGALAHAEEKGKELPAVTATGKRAITNNWKTNSERNISSVRDLLADRVDINAGGGGASAQFLSIRGTGQNRIDMVVDGTTTGTQLWYHQGRFQLDPEMVRVIGVDKGAGSASAGIGATSGAIRSQTVDAKDLLLDGKPFGARLSTQFNSNKGIGGSAAVYGNINGFDALLLGSWRDNKNYKAGKGYQNGDTTGKYAANVVRNSARKQGNYLAKFGYTVNPDHKFGLSYRREHYFGNSWERPEFATYGDDTGDIDNIQQTVNASYAGKNLGFVNQLDANVFYIKGEDERENWQRKRENGKQITYNAGGGRKSETDTWGSNVNVNSMLFGKHTLKYGVNWRKEETASRAGDWQVDGERKNEVGVYAEGIWALDPVTLTTGLRYDHFDLRTLGNQIPEKAGATKVRKGSVNPSVGVIWDVTPDLSLNAKFNYASRSPALASAATLTDNRGKGKARGWRNVDGGLKAEQARLAQIGFNWQHAGASVDGNVYHQHTKNFYSTLNDGLIHNRGTLKTTGYELNGTYNWKGLTARAGVSYANPKANFDLSNDPLDLLPQGRQWLTALSYRWDKPNLEVGWRGRYVQSKTYHAFDSQSRKLEQQHRSGYGVHDIYANWKPLGEAMNVNVAVNNVGNKLYRSHSQRNSAITPPNPGREVSLGVNYRF